MAATANQALDTGAQLNPSDPNSVNVAGNLALASSAPPYQPLVNNPGTTIFDPNLGTTGSVYNSTIYQESANALHPQNILQPSTTLTYKPIQNTPDQELTYTGLPYLPNAPTAQTGTAQAGLTLAGPAAQAGTAQAAPTSQVGTPQAGLTTANTAQAGVTQATAAQVGTPGFNPAQTYDATQAQAAHGTVDPNSLIQNQFNQLTQNSDSNGDGIPDWATNAVTAANQRMNALGLGASTMAGGATAAAILQTALPMAQFNADLVGKLNLQNLSNDQQTLLSNAAWDNAAKQFNATSIQQNQQFFTSLTAQIADQNANRETTVSTFNAGQTNAAAQFNAQQANTVSTFNAGQANALAQFNAQLSATVGLSNAQRADALNQFNAQQKNAQDQFNVQQQDAQDTFNAAQANAVAQSNAAQANVVGQSNTDQANKMAQFNNNLESQRQEFNTQNQLLVDQSNVQWRRTINTANTAGENAANQANTMNTFNVSQTDLNNLWQQARDEASWSLTAGENSQNRTLSLVNSSLNRQTSLDILNSQMQAQMYSQLGGFGVNLLGGLFGGSGASGIGQGISNFFGGSSSSNVNFTGPNGAALPTSSAGDGFGFTNAADAVSNGFIFPT